MKQLYDVGKLTDEVVAGLFAEYFRNILSKKARNIPLSRDEKLILTQFKYKKRPCQVNNGMINNENEAKCPYGSSLESCTYSNGHGCFMNEIIINFAESKVLLQ